VYACPALRPRWADSSLPWIGRADAAFRLFHTVSPTRTVLSRLHHAAHIRAVYASQGGSPRHHARRASRLLARPCLGRTCTCWAPISNFKKVVCLSSFPFKPDFPGARKIYGKRGGRNHFLCPQRAHTAFGEEERPFSCATTCLQIKCAANRCAASFFTEEIRRWP